MRTMVNPKMCCIILIHKKPKPSNTKSPPRSYPPSYSAAGSAESLPHYYEVVREKWNERLWNRFLASLAISPVYRALGQTFPGQTWQVSQSFHSKGDSIDRGQKLGRAGKVKAGNGQKTMHRGGLHGALLVGVLVIVIVIVILWIFILYRKRAAIREAINEYRRKKKVSVVDA